ncbi:unnamed protein product [Oikopleura dioica]|uniref:Chromo domain-containing protein n=1 Tax=Oikopleura dioica TaxID=34765 RepID=E4X365_OIKDI|nr:unnamed protein product [Oikopleura dioica]
MPKILAMIDQGEDIWLPVWRLLPKHILDFERKQVTSDLPPIKSPRVEEVRKFREAERAKKLKKLEEKRAQEQKEDENNEDSTEEEWEVEKILDIRLDDDGDKEYLVHWKEYPESEATWEPIENLEGATQEIENFHNKNPKKRAKKVKKADNMKELLEEQLFGNKEEDNDAEPERDLSPDFLDAMDASENVENSDSSDDDFEPGVSPMRKKRKKENENIPTPALPVMMSAEEVFAQKVEQIQKQIDAKRTTLPLPRILDRSPKFTLEQIKNMQILTLPNASPQIKTVSSMPDSDYITFKKHSETHCSFYISKKMTDRFFDRRSKWTSFYNPKKFAGPRKKITLKLPINLEHGFKYICGHRNEEEAFKFMLSIIGKQNWDKCFNSEVIDVTIKLRPVIVDPQNPDAPIDLTDDDDIARNLPKPAAVFNNIEGSTGLEVKSAFDPVSKKRKHIFIEPEAEPPNITNAIVPQQNPIIEEPKEKDPETAKVKVESPETTQEKSSLMPKRTARNKKLLSPSKAQNVPVMTVRPNPKITEASPRHAILGRYHDEINHSDIVMNGLHCHYKFCTYRFSDADPKFGEVEAHYQEFHGYACSNMSRRTTCHDCQIPFNTLKDLSDHDAHYHQKASVITQECGFARSVLRCKYCSREFKTQEEHLHHQYNDHVPAVKCDHCPFIARSLPQLHSHFILHYGVQEQICQICNATSKSKADLNEHMLKIHQNGTITDPQTLARDLLMTESVPGTSMGLL